jgi:uncharacterized protein (TIGR03067 family)
MTMVTILCLISLYPAAEPPKALGELEGRWKVVAAEEVGTVINEAAAASGKQFFVIKGDTLAIERNGKLKGVFKLSVPSGQGQSLDLKHTTGQFKDTTCHAIYKLEDGKLTICTASKLRSDNVKDRPTVFSTKKQDAAEARPGKLLFVLKREKK